jgi:hypothetical protein
MRYYICQCPLLIYSTNDNDTSRSSIDFFVDSSIVVRIDKFVHSVETLFFSQPTSTLLNYQSHRSIARIPHWERHIRFDPKYGRKRPCQDVLDRFRRLNNGMWISAHRGGTVKVSSCAIEPMLPIPTTVSAISEGSTMGSDERILRDMHKGTMLDAR